MLVVTRVVQKILALLVPTAASLAASEAPKAATPAQPMPIATLVKRLSEEPGLRARFAENPRAVLSAAGIDPAPLQLGERIGEPEIDRLIARWRRAEGAIRLAAEQGGRNQRQTEGPPPEQVSPPAAVYGPPAGMRPQPPEPVVPPPPPLPVPRRDGTGPRPEPPAPVYGPPPGLRRP